MEIESYHVQTVIAGYSALPREDYELHVSVIFPCPMKSERETERNALLLGDVQEKTNRKMVSPLGGFLCRYLEVFQQHHKIVNTDSKIGCRTFTECP